MVCILFKKTCHTELSFVYYHKVILCNDIKYNHPKNTTLEQWYWTLLLQPSINQPINPWLQAGPSSLTTEHTDIGTGLFALQNFLKDAIITVYLGVPHDKNDEHADHKYAWKDVNVKQQDGSLSGKFILMH